MLTGHVRKRAYLHGFKLLDDATCICGQGDQTTDHLLNHCSAINTQREVLIQNVLKNGKWPASKQDLITKYRDCFITFIESINFELLNRCDKYIGQIGVTLTTITDVIST